MKFIYLLISLGILNAGQVAFSQTTGAEFPKIEAENTLNEKVAIPRDTKGKYTLVGLAFSKRSEDDLKTWFNPVYSTFIDKPTGIFADFAYDVNVYFVPMFTGIKAMAAGSAKNKAAREVDPKLQPYVIFYKGSLKEYREALGLDEKDLPYFFVLDKVGKIIYSTAGRYTTQKMKEIEALIQ